jgi:hypothetical protein
MAIGDLSKYPVKSAHTATPADSIALAKEEKRAYARLTNLSPDVRVYVAFGEAAVIGQGEVIGPGGGWITLRPYADEYSLYEAEDIHVITAGGTAELAIEEQNK